MKKDKAIQQALRKFKPRKRPAAKRPTIQIIGAKRGLVVTPEIEFAICHFIRCANHKETVGAAAYRDCYRALDRLTALLGKKAMFRVGAGPAFKLRKPTVIISKPKEIEYVRTDGRTHSLQWSEVDAERAGFTFQENQLPL